MLDLIVLGEVPVSREVIRGGLRSHRKVSCKIVRRQGRCNIVLLAAAFLAVSVASAGAAGAGGAQAGRQSSASSALSESRSQRLLRQSRTAGLQLRGGEAESGTMAAVTKAGGGTLYLIGLGLGDEKDITVAGLEVQPLRSPPHPPSIARTQTRSTRPQHHFYTAKHPALIVVFSKSH